MGPATKSVEMLCLFAHSLFPLCLFMLICDLSVEATSHTGLTLFNQKLLILHFFLLNSAKCTCECIHLLCSTFTILCLATVTTVFMCYLLKSTSAKRCDSFTL